MGYLVRKRDGQFQGFDESRLKRVLTEVITQTRSEEVPHESLGIAGELSQSIQHFLFRGPAEVTDFRARPGRIVTSEEISTAAIKALEETGHTAASELFRTFSAARLARRLNIYVETDKSRTRNGQPVLIPWAKSLVVRKLLDKLDLRKSVAEKVARDVETAVFQSVHSRLTQAQFRQLIDDALERNGCVERLGRSIQFGIPKIRADKVISRFQHRPSAIVELGSSIAEQYLRHSIFKADQREQISQQLFSLHSRTPGLYELAIQAAPIQSVDELFECLATRRFDGLTTLLLPLTIECCEEFFAQGESVFKLIQSLTSGANQLVLPSEFESLDTAPRRLSCCFRNSRKTVDRLRTQTANSASWIAPRWNFERSTASKNYGYWQQIDGAREILEVVSIDLFACALTAGPGDRDQFIDVIETQVEEAVGILHEIYQFRTKLAQQQPMPLWQSTEEIRELRSLQSRPTNAQQVVGIEPKNLQAAMSYLTGESIEQNERVTELAIEVLQHFRQFVREHARDVKPMKLETFDLRMFARNSVTSGNWESIDLDLESVVDPFCSGLPLVSTKIRRKLCKALGVGMVHQV